MNKSMKRSIKTRQVDMRMLQFEVDTTSTDATGFDDSQIKEVIINGAGDVTVVFKNPFSPQNSDKPKAMLTCLDPDRAAHMYASDYDRVSIQVTDLAAADQDGSVSVMVVGTNHRFSY